VTALLLLLLGCGSSVHTWGIDDDSATVDDDSETGDDDTVSDDDSSAADAVQPLLDVLQDPGATAGELHPLLAGVSQGEGWPLRGDGRFLFVTAWPGAPQAVGLVSDLVGWDAPGRTATAAPAGEGEIWYVVVDEDSFLVAPEGAKYKWWGSGDLWRAPPEARSYGFDTFGEFGWVRPDPALSHLERYPGLDVHTGAPPRTTRLYLPADWDSLDPATVPAVFLHDGQNLFDPGAPWGGWRVDTLLDSGDWGPVVVVAVDSGADRLDAYGPAVDLHPSLGEEHGGGADLYLTQVREGILPFVRDRYGLRADPQGWTVGGSSMGGLVSLHFALEADDTFGCAVAMSPSLGWGAFDPLLSGEDAMVHRFQEAGRGSVSIWLDSGGGPGTGCVDADGDGVVENSEDEDNYCVTAQLRDELSSLGYAFGQDLGHWWEPDAPHNEAAWAERFWRALDHCLP
jgi:predicted alpha/beta superfamily hydrolase